MGSGHVTTNRSVGQAHGCMTLLSIKTADSAQPRIAQWSPDPFPCERMGSGHETKRHLAIRDKLLVPNGVHYREIPQYFTAQQGLFNASQALPTKSGNTASLHDNCHILNSTMSV